MKIEQIKSLIIGFLLLIIFFQYKSCNSEKTEISEIPEIRGKFEAVKPNNSKVGLINPKTKKIDKTVSKRLEKEYNFKSEEIERMAQEMAEIEALADSLAYSNHELSEIVTNYAQINEFKHTFSDDNIKVNVSGVTFKNIAERVKIDYEIKERKIEIPKQTAFRILAGGSIGNDKQFNNFVAAGNVGFQNRSGKVFTIGYDTESRFSVGLLLPLVSFGR